VRRQNRAAVHFHNYRDWKNEPDVLGDDVSSHKVNLLGCVTPVLVTMKVTDIGMVSGVSCGFSVDAQQPSVVLDDEIAGAAVSLVLTERTC
jgi:hypothetical protein